MDEIIPDEKELKREALGILESIQNEARILYKDIRDGRASVPPHTEKNELVNILRLLLTLQCDLEIKNVS
jgi:hypothetical protein